MGTPMTKVEIEAYQTAAKQLLDLEANAFENDPDELETMFIGDILQPLVKTLEDRGRDVITLMWLMTYIRELR